MPLMVPGKWGPGFQLGMGGPCLCPRLSSELLPHSRVLLWEKLHRHSPSPCVEREASGEQLRAQLAGANGAASSGPAAPRVPHCPRCPQRDGRVPQSQMEPGGPNEGCRGRAY